MSINQDGVRRFVQRKLASAKAEKGWTWGDVSALYRLMGVKQTETTLTTKHSRGSFRVQDFFVMLRAMGVRSIDLSDLDIAGLEEAIRKVEVRKQKAKTVKSSR